MSDFIKPPTLPLPKPDMVNIKSHQVVAAASPNGMTLLITGLGDDNLIYAYDGPKGKWYKQQ